MQIRIDFGREHVDVTVADERLIELHRQPQAPAVGDVAAAVRQALEEPTRFPALRRALTPDDHVVLVIDETLSPSVELLAPLFEHLEQAGVARATLTVVFASESSQGRWRELLPAGMQQEVHDATDRKRLAYLATTKGGRRIYLNRTVVDADQTVVLTRRGYDPLLGYAGGAGALYPALSDEATIQEMWDQLSMEVPDETAWPIRAEAAEVAWLLGAPFFVQVIPEAGEGIAHIVTGVVESAQDADRLLDARWRTTVDRLANTVVAAVSGDPAQLDFGDLAGALACASRIVKPQGRIVLLARGGTTLGPGAEMVRSTDSAEEALTTLREQQPADLAAAYQWANAVQQASVFLLGDFPEELAEELFVTPLQNARQAQRLIDAAESCVILQDAHKMMAVME